MFVQRVLHAGHLPCKLEGILVAVQEGVVHVGLKVGDEADGFPGKSLVDNHLATFKLPFGGGWHASHIPDWVARVGGPVIWPEQRAGGLVLVSLEEEGWVLDRGAVSIEHEDFLKVSVEEGKRLELERTGTNVGSNVCGLVVVGNVVSLDTVLVEEAKGGGRDFVFAVVPDLDSELASEFTNGSNRDHRVTEVVATGNHDNTTPVEFISWVFWDLFDNFLHASMFDVGRQCCLVPTNLEEEGRKKKREKRKKSCCQQCTRRGANSDSKARKA